MSQPTSYLVPTVIENEGRYERAYDIYSRLLKDRIIFLNEEVNSATANIIVAELLFLQAEDPKKDIYFYINSPGGSVYDALAIYDTMQHVSCDIQTVGVGMQASAAAFLLSSGAKGKRFALPNATVMIHQPSSGTRGKVTDQEIDLKESLRIKRLLEGIMAKNTGQKIEKIHEDMERDKWLTADEAKKYGIVDKVITQAPKATK
ncbi:MAG TPA: ATP-dependent Clp protease proteolytic subunit [Candidatus Saccharimonadales bacterium]|jgi:ATP-dependent Clp protease protease subunit|nr:ATP-dependent Clp protease proteolytic subunit [Candidatus Saccharimonadales bacterium]